MFASKYERFLLACGDCDSFLPDEFRIDLQWCGPDGRLDNDLLPHSERRRELQHAQHCFSELMPPVWLPASFKDAVWLEWRRLRPEISNSDR